MRNKSDLRGETAEEWIGKVGRPDKSSSVAVKLGSVFSLKPEMIHCFGNLDPRTISNH